MVSQTSVDTYTQLQEDDELEPKQDEVYQALKTEGECTRRELRENQLPSWELSSISGRVNELIEKDLVKKTGTRPCNFSGRKAETIKVKFK